MFQSTSLRAGLLALAPLALPLSASAFDVAAPSAVPAGEKVMVITLTKPADLAPMIKDSQLSKEYAELMTTLGAGSPEYMEFMGIVNNLYASLGENTTLSSMMAEVITGMDAYLSPTPEGTLGSTVVIEFVSEEKAKTFYGFLNEEIKRQSTKDVAQGLPGTEYVEQELEGVKIQADELNSSYNAQKGNLIYLASEKAFLGSSLKGEGLESLAMIPNIASLEGKLEVLGDGLLYVDLDGMMKYGEGLGDAAGTAGGGQTIVSLDVEQNILRSNYYFKPKTLTETRKQMMAITAAGNADIAGFLPSNSIVGYTTNVMDPTIIANGYKELNADPASAQQFMMLEMMAMQSGMSISEDVIPAFGPLVAVSLGAPAPTSPLPIPSLTVAAKIANQEKANKIITAIETNLLAQATESARQMNPQAPEAQIQAKEVAGTPVRSVMFTTPLVPLEVSHALTADGFYLLGFGSLDGALLAKSSGDSLTNSAEWKSLAPQSFQQFNHFSKVNTTSLAAFLRQVVPLVAPMTGMGPDQMTQFNQFVDVVDSTGVVYNATRSDAEGVHGFTVLKIK